MEDEKGKSNKVSKERRRRADCQEKKKEKEIAWTNFLGCPLRRDRDERERRGEGRGERKGRDGQGDGEDDGMAWASFLERETVPCWETTTKLGEKRTGDLYK